LLSYTTGSLDIAVSSFEAALHFCRYAGYRPELAWSCLDFAQALIARDCKDDRGHAASLLTESEAIATELGMRPLLARLAIFRQRNQEKLDRNEGALSSREREVAQLLAQGKTNQEIADDLFISSHTVAAHVARILAKTGCKNRTEAAAYIERELRIATATEK
jgi:DNA-binding CsgD family transcriptional regulator